MFNFLKKFVKVQKVFGVYWDKNYCSRCLDCKTKLIMKDGILQCPDCGNKYVLREANGRLISYLSAKMKVQLDELNEEEKRDLMIDIKVGKLMDEDMMENVR